MARGDVDGAATDLLALLGECLRLFSPAEIKDMLASTYAPLLDELPDAAHVGPATFRQRVAEGLKGRGISPELLQRIVDVRPDAADLVRRLAHASALPVIVVTPKKSPIVLLVALVVAGGLGLVQAPVQGPRYRRGDAMMKPLVLFVTLALLSCSAACSRLRYKQLREAANQVVVKEQDLGVGSGGGDDAGSDLSASLAELLQRG